jgi:hypothetical protein
MFSRSVACLKLYFYSSLSYNIKARECWPDAIGWPRSSGETWVVASKTWQSCEWLTSLRKPTVGPQVSPLPTVASSLSIVGSLTLPARRALILLKRLASFLQPTVETQKQCNRFIHIQKIFAWHFLVFLTWRHVVIRVRTWSSFSFFFTVWTVQRYSCEIFLRQTQRLPQLPCSSR